MLQDGAEWKGWHGDVCCNSPGNGEYVMMNDQMNDNTAGDAGVLAGHRRAGHHW